MEAARKRAWRIRGDLPETETDSSEIYSPAEDARFLFVNIQNAPLGVDVLSGLYNVSGSSESTEVAPSKVSSCIVES